MFDVKQLKRRSAGVSLAVMLLSAPLAASYGATEGLTTFAQAADPITVEEDDGFPWGILGLLGLLGLAGLKRNDDRDRVRADRTTTTRP